MPYIQRRRKRRYRLKPVPIFIALLVVVAAVVFTVSLLGKKDSDARTSSSPQSGEQDSSSPQSGEQDSSSPQSDEQDSSSPQSGEQDSSSPQSDEQDSSSPQSSKASDSSSASDTVATPTDAGEWNMILLNSTTKTLEKDMVFEKTKFDTQYIDSRVAPAYKAMCDAAKIDGITLYLRSGYRSIATQTTNYNAAVERYKKTNTAQEAIRLTDQYYARPGQSEHHTGLALDIITPEYHKTVYTLNEQFVETKAYEWLVKHCSEYGFILRYPKDKVDITKINYEPWHYRYVGVDAARYITQNNLAFEEYTP